MFEVNSLVCRVHSTMKIYVIVFAVVSSISSSFLVEAVVLNRRTQSLQSWQHTVKEVTGSSTMSQVLQEYLKDIEIVEGAASPCSIQHRNIHTKGAESLRLIVDGCQVTAAQSKDALASCVEEGSRSQVSELRDQITKLKTCVDRAPHRSTR